VKRQRGGTEGGGSKRSKSSERSEGSAAESPARGRSRHKKVYAKTNADATQKRIRAMEASESTGVQTRIDAARRLSSFVFFSPTLPRFFFTHTHTLSLSVFLFCSLSYRVSRVNLSSFFSFLACCAALLEERRSVLVDVACHPRER